MSKQKVQIDVLRRNPTTIGKTDTRTPRKRPKIPRTDTHGTYKTQKGERNRFQDPRTKIQNELQTENK